MNLQRRLAEVQLAVMLLTRLPVGRIAGTAPELSDARWAFPLVGALIGLLTWVAHAGALWFGAPPLLAALLALAGLALLTGALHFDGLADYADGVGGGRDADHALEIMRDSRIGTYGVIALILVIGIWTVSVAAVSPGPLTFAAAGLLSRCAMVALQVVLPPARPDGMASLAAGPTRSARLVLSILAVGALIIWPLPLFACVLVVVWIGWQSTRKICGQTGDVLGATQLLSEAAIWVVLASQTG